MNLYNYFTRYRLFVVLKLLLTYLFIYLLTTTRCSRKLMRHSLYHLYSVALAKIQATVIEGI
jgi:hypothetical protein